MLQTQNGDDLNGIFSYFGRPWDDRMLIYRFRTDCHIQWDSDHMYQIVPGQWTSIVNPASMTDEDGKGKIVFAVWEEFIGRTVTIYGGYTDDCGHHFVDSVKVKVVNNE